MRGTSLQQTIPAYFLPHGFVVGILVICFSQEVLPRPFSSSTPSSSDSLTDFSVFFASGEMTSSEYENDDSTLSSKSSSANPLTVQTEMFSTSKSVQIKPSIQSISANSFNRETTTHSSSSHVVKHSSYDNDRLQVEESVTDSTESVSSSTVTDTDSFSDLSEDYSDNANHTVPSDFVNNNENSEDRTESLSVVSKEKLGSNSLNPLMVRNKRPDNKSISLEGRSLNQNSSSSSLAKSHNFTSPTETSVEITTTRSAVTVVNNVRSDDTNHSHSSVVTPKSVEKTLLTNESSSDHYRPILTESERNPVAGAEFSLNASHTSDTQSVKSGGVHSSTNSSSGLSGSSATVSVVNVTSTKVLAETTAAATRMAVTTTTETPGLPSLTINWERLQPFGESAATAFVETSSRSYPPAVHPRIALVRTTKHRVSSSDSAGGNPVVTVATFPITTEDRMEGSEVSLDSEVTDASFPKTPLSSVSSVSPTKEVGTVESSTTSYFYSDPTMLSIHRSEDPLGIGAIVGITLGVLGVVILVGGLFGFLLYHRKLRPLSEVKYPTDNCGYVDDTLRVSYVNNHIELPKENSEEMFSLDNDSFLNSLEAMTLQNYWAEDAKNTKV